MDEIYGNLMNLNNILDETNRKIDKFENSQCLHQNCSECNGTGIKNDGSPCIHMISCLCSKCNPKYNVNRTLK